MLTARHGVSPIHTLLVSRLLATLGGVVAITSGGGGYAIEDGDFLKRLLPDFDVGPGHVAKIRRESVVGLDCRDLGSHRGQPARHSTGPGTNL